MTEFKKEDPLEYFITAGKNKAAGPTASKAEAGPAKPETKSKRLNLLLRPSIYEELKEISHENYTSINNMINEILEQYIKEKRR